MVRRIKGIITKVGISTLAFALPVILHAQTVVNAEYILGGTNNAGKIGGLGSKDLQSTIGGLIRVFMGLLGTVAVVIILIGGFMWMTAGGNEEKVEKAKKMIGAGVIGLAIILAAYSITQFVITSLVNATA